MINQVKDITMRHEEKYICSESYLRILESRLSGFLCLDKNQSDEGYGIRSLYFDTVSDVLFEEGLQGLERRDKYRIRIYNCNADTIKLEKKTSIRNLKKKTTELLERTYVTDLIANEEPADVSDCEKDSLLSEFMLLQKTALLRPKIIVDYKRKAFVSGAGNIRITLDRDISTTDKVDDFFEPDTELLPILPSGIHLLEVKYDGIFPGYLARALNFEKLERTSFSKYVLSRDVMKNNGRIRGIYEF